MAGIKDAFADLLCNEEDTKAGLSSFDDDDDFIISSDHRKINIEESEPLLDPLSDESVGWMVERERHHLPRHDYVARLRNGDLNLRFRSEALDWIVKACCHHNLGGLCLYTAMNFLDRFLSLHDLPGGREWAIQLLAVSCLSLSAKINEVNVPCAADLQVGEPKFLFQGRSIQRMEILVLNCLNWNMNSCTPFSFIDYFLRKVNTDVDAHAHAPIGSLIERSLKIILGTVKGIEFLEFRPSEIAAAVAVFVSDEKQGAIDMDDDDDDDGDKALFGCIGVEKGRIVECLGMVGDLVSRMNAAATSCASTLLKDEMEMVGCRNSTSASASMDSSNEDGSGSTSTCVATDDGEGVVIIPASPNGVLDAAALVRKRRRMKRTTTTTTVTTEEEEEESKRRKLDHHHHHITPPLP
ncbi:cyclin-D4-2-like [Andrographis paniculata]|uniref:cyclin-D4-2-like n=1 Tax=Andrographis paniculata TaxID=175694 RepID=UPI0021E94766|nr:cyclin-D4-2-like [Andrographis paniculata]